MPGKAAAAVVTADGFRGKPPPGRKMEPPLTVTPFSPGKVMVDVTAGVTVVTCKEKVSFRPDLSLKFINLKTYWI